MRIDDFNPDAMDVEDLEAFVESYKGYRYWSDTHPAREFFNGQTLKGCGVAFSDCLRYAENMAKAMRQRMAGNIPSALEYESFCEQIYSELPDYAKW